MTLLALHGKLHQLRRMAIYDEFCQTESAVVLIATDVAARGLGKTIFFYHFGYFYRFFLLFFKILAPQGRHGEFEPGKVQFSTPKFFHQLFLIRSY